MISREDITMDLLLFAQALLSLVFVLGLVFVVFWLLKVAEQKGWKSPFFKKLSVTGRLSIVESKRLDARNTLVLARCDKEEYLLLLGNTQSLILNTKKADKNA